MSVKKPRPSGEPGEEADAVDERSVPHPVLRSPSHADVHHPARSRVHDADVPRGDSAPLPRNNSLLSSEGTGELLHVAPLQDALPRKGSLRVLQRKQSSEPLRDSGPLEHVAHGSSGVGMTTSASCTSLTSSSHPNPGEPSAAIKKTEIKKLRDCLGLDDATALRKLQELVETRRDRNYLADMVILKETNAQLRKKVEDLKADLQNKDQHTTKLLDMLKLRSFESKEANAAVKKMKAEMNNFDGVKAQVLLLQRQLQDTMQHLEEERSFTTRTVENAMLSAAKRGQPVGAPILSLQLRTVTVSAVAGLAAAACTYILHSDEPSPSSAGLPHVPGLVCATVAVSVIAAATTQRALPQRTSRGANTDAAITRFQFAPSVEDVPRGQELLKTVYHLQCELSQLRRESATSGSQPDKSRKLIDKLSKAVGEKDRQMEELQAKSEERIDGIKLKLQRMETHMASLQMMYQGACHELVRLKKGAVASEALRSQPVAIPMAGGCNHERGSTTAAGRDRNAGAGTPQTVVQLFRAAESPSKCSVGGSDDELYIEGHSVPASDSEKPLLPLAAPQLESS